MIKIAICGSSKNKLPNSLVKKAREIGEVLAKDKKVVIFTGATTGYSHEVAERAFACGGFTIGISPAENYREHVKTYKLPTTPYKILIYTGLGYKARDVILIRSIDAVIFIGGGIGTITELCIAIDNEKVIGVLEGSGEATLLFDKIAKVSHRNKPQFIYESDPQLLVEKIIKTVCKRKNYDS